MVNYYCFFSENLVSLALYTWRILLGGTLSRKITLAIYLHALAVFGLQGKKLFGVGRPGSGRQSQMPSPSSSRGKMCATHFLFTRVELQRCRVMEMCF
jgi:hypothetical protein